MPANSQRVRDLAGASVIARVVAALQWQTLAAVALVTLLLSLTALSSSGLLDFFSPAEILLAWLHYLGELAVIAAVLLTGFVLLDVLLAQDMPFRPLAIASSLLALSVVLAIGLHAYYAGGFEHLPPPLRMLGDSLRWGLPAAFLALIADVHRRTLSAAAAAHSAELARAQAQQAEIEQQLSLLQAQIEPHFLFNILGNVRRLYRTQPHAGASAIDSLMRYLRTALPQLRSRRTSLGEELDVARAYLDLFQLRMGNRLTYAINVDETLLDAEFPPMLLVTLVENAIKHGLEPIGRGSVAIRARRRQDLLEVSVADTGVGFGAAASSGAGVGLVNIKRQLAARYSGRARMLLEQGEPRGARATIVVPLCDRKAVAEPVRQAVPSGG